MDNIENVSFALTTPACATLISVMRNGRIKADPGEAALYHCSSHAVASEPAFDHGTRSFMVDFMWKLARFHGCQIHDYSMLPTEFHIFVKMPGKLKLGPAEVLERLEDYYGKDSRRYREFKGLMERGGRALKRKIRKYLKRMLDISEYMKVYKQCVTGWYNTQKQREGTLWMSRFRGPLIDDDPEIRRVVGGYIGMDAVRAGIVSNPGHYRYCAYGAALGGDVRARGALKALTGQRCWSKARMEYRLRVTDGGESTANVSDPEGVEGKGKGTLRALLLQRWDFLKRGLVIGTKEFVSEYARRCQIRERRLKRPWRARCVLTYAKLTIWTLNPLRKPAVV